MINWKHENKEILSIYDMPKGCCGFIYEVKFLGIDNSIYNYYGKKSLQFKTRKKPTKASGKKRIIKGVKESDWKEYFGSSYNVENLLNEGKIKIIEKNIIKYCFSKAELNYEETKILFIKSVLEDAYSFNENILGKYFFKVEKLWKKIKE